MIKQRRNKNLWAMLLSVALIVTQLPAVAMAENAAPEDGSIASFEPLDSGDADNSVSGNTTGRPTEPFFCTQTEGCALEDGHAGECKTKTVVITVTAFDELDEAVRFQTAPAGTALDDLTLPATLDASGYTATDEPAPEPEPITIDGVTWEPDSPWDETAEQGGYTFTPVLPAGYALADAVELPEIDVLIGGAAVTFAAQSDVLTVTFRDNGNSDQSNNSNMKGVIDAILARFGPDSYKNFSTIMLVGDETEITGYNWKYLIDQFNENSGWDSLTALDLSRMASLEAIRQDTGIPNVQATKLTNLILPDSMIEIGARAFDGCTNLALQELPAGVEKIGESAFSGCRSLALPALPVGLTQIGDGAFSGCRSLALQELPAGLTQIGDGAFSGCRSLALQELPAGLIQIETNAFGGCTSLALQALPAGVEKIGERAFYGCRSLALPALPAGLTQIGDGAFSGCRSLALQELPAGLIQIEANAFYGCTSLALQALPAGVTQIGDGAFFGCKSLGKIIMEPITAPTLGTGAFNNTSSGLVFYVPANGTNYDSGGWDSLNTVRYSPTTGISLPPTLELWPNGSGTLTATLTPDDAVPIVLWESSDTGIVTVDDAGNLTAIAEGKATIKATSWQGGKTAACTVTVKSGSDATLKSLSLSSGALTPVFSASVTDYTATVDNSTNSVTITAEANDSEATVIGGGTKDLNVGENPFTVTVTARDGTPKSYTITITRDKAPTILVTGVTLDKSAYTLYTNKDPHSFQLTATVTPANASNKAVSWKSSDTNIATVDGSGNVTAVAKGTATITVTTTDGGKKAACTVTVETDTSGNGGGNSSGNGGSSRNDYTITMPQPPKPNNPVLVVIELPVTVGNGAATGKPDDGRTALAIAGAGRDARARTNGIAVQYDAKAASAYDGFSITIRRATLDRLIAAKVKYVTLNTGIVDLTLDLAALKEIAAKSTGDTTLTATRETGLAGDALAAVGSRPAYRLAVNYTGKDGKTATVQDFGAGRVTVGLAYQPATAEQTGSLFLVYSKDGKGVEWLYQSSYDRTSGNVIASTGHFSVYGVGYKPAPAFTDTVNHWAKADIEFAAARGLLTGTSKTTFSPDASMTRGMFVTALGRLAGIDPAQYKNTKFSDVAATAYYAPYVTWAAEQGIVNGITDTSFAPDTNISREQMAVIMQNYAKTMGYTVPKTREAVTFADNGSIESWAKDAVKAMQMAGVMNGKDGNRLDPKASATRAEGSAVLRRFVEIVIDPGTATGWAKNDSGHWLYYKGGNRYDDIGNE